jgi:Arc/MetJ family transcription regulator
MVAHFMSGKENSPNSTFSNVYGFSIFVCMKTTRTNIELNDQLIADILKFGESKTKREAVEKALQDHLRLLKRKKLASLRGKINWEGNLNEMRTNKIK